MRCEEAEDLMQRDMDDDLSEEEKALLRNHCAECRVCAEMYEKLVRLNADLSSLPKVVPPVSIVDQVMARIEQDLAKDALAAGGGQRRPFFRWGVIGTAAAAVILGLGLTRLFDLQPHSQQEISMSNVQPEKADADLPADGGASGNRPLPESRRDAGTDSSLRQRQAGANAVPPSAGDQTGAADKKPEIAMAPEQPGSSEPSVPLTLSENSSQADIPNQKSTPFSADPNPFSRMEKERADEKQPSTSGGKALPPSVEAPSGADAAAPDESAPAPAPHGEMAIAPQSSGGQETQMGIMAAPQGLGRDGGTAEFHSVAEASSPSGKYRAVMRWDAQNNQQRLVIVDGHGRVIGQTHAWTRGGDEQVEWLNEQEVKYSYRAGSSGAIETWQYHLSTHDERQVKTSPADEGGFIRE